MDMDLSLTKTDFFLQTILNYDSNGLGPKLDKDLVFLVNVCKPNSQILYFLVEPNEIRKHGSIGC